MIEAAWWRALAWICLNPDHHSLRRSLAGNRSNAISSFCQDRQKRTGRTSLSHSLRQHCESWILPPSGSIIMIFIITIWYQFPRAEPRPPPSPGDDSSGTAFSSSDAPPLVGADGIPEQQVNSALYHYSITKHFSLRRGALRSSAPWHVRPWHAPQRCSSSTLAQPSRRPCAEPATLLRHPRSIPPPCRPRAAPKPPSCRCGGVRAVQDTGECRQRLTGWLAPRCKALLFRWSVCASLTLTRIIRSGFNLAPSLFCCLLPETLGIRRSMQASSRIPIARQSNLQWYWNSVEHAVHCKLPS